MSISHASLDLLACTSPGNFRAMPGQTVQLVLQYDGSRFAGWQRQRNARTVQGEIEGVLERLFRTPATVIGAGRTDAGVHARGQAAHVHVTERWTAATLRRAVNALLPQDVWVASAHEMVDGFHARFSATARRYTYRVGIDEGADSPFRRPYEWHVAEHLDTSVLDALAAVLQGAHAFRGFAVRGTAPERDQHVCVVSAAYWTRDGGRLTFHIEANRFLHHMVRFLVGTMVDVARGRRTPESFHALLAASANTGVSPPAPARGLFLDGVLYPTNLYREDV